MRSLNALSRMHGKGLELAKEMPNGTCIGTQANYVAHDVRRSAPSKNLRTPLKFPLDKQLYLCYNTNTIKERKNEMDKLMILKELEGLTDAQLNSVIDAAKLQLDLRERTNNERFFELLRPVKDAIKNLVFEFPQTHCSVDGEDIFLEDLVDENAEGFWSYKY